MGLINKVLNVGKSIISLPSRLEEIINKPFGTSDVDLDENILKEFRKYREESNPIEFASEQYELSERQVQHASSKIKRRIGEMFVVYLPIALGMKEAEWELIPFETYGILSYAAYAGVAFQSYMIYGSIKRYFKARKKKKKAKENAIAARKEKIFLDYMDEKIAEAMDDNEKSELEQLKEKIANLQAMINSKNEDRVVEAIDFTLKNKSEHTKAHENYSPVYTTHIEIMPYILYKLETGPIDIPTRIQKKIDEAELERYDITFLDDGDFLSDNDLTPVDLSMFDRPREDETEEIRYSSPLIPAHIKDAGSDPMMKAVNSDEEKNIRMKLNNPIRKPNQ